MILSDWTKLLFRFVGCHLFQIRDTAERFVCDWLGYGAALASLKVSEAREGEKGVYVCMYTLYIYVASGV